jgi:hypothetical protein
MFDLAPRTEQEQLLALILAVVVAAGIGALILEVV